MVLLVRTSCLQEIQAGCGVGGHVKGQRSGDECEPGGASLRHPANHSVSQTQGGKKTNQEAIIIPTYVAIFKAQIMLSLYHKIGPNLFRDETDLCNPSLYIKLTASFR